MAEPERNRLLSQRLGSILDGIADGITVQDTTGRLVYANQAAATSSGFTSPEQFLAASLPGVVARFELLDIHGEPLDPASFPGRRVLAGEPAGELTLCRRERATGREFWAQVRASAVLDEHGRVELAISIWHDITEAQRRRLHEDYLARATIALSRSLDYAAALSTLAGLLVPGLADWCVIHLLEGDELAPVAVVHADPERVAAAHEINAKYPPHPNAQRGVWNVQRTGTSELYPEIADHLLAMIAQDPEHLEILRAVGMRSAMIVPIRVRERVLGVVTLIYATHQRRYDARDLALAEELGRRAGQSIENTRLYAAEKKARDQLSLLARAGETFAAAADYDELRRAVVDSALPMLGDFGVLDIRESDGQVRRTAAVFGDDALAARLSATAWQPHAWSEKNLSALASGSSAYHPQIDDAWRAACARDAEHLELLRALALRSLITVPLHTRGELLGALTLGFGHSRRAHTADDLALAEELARRAGLAVLQVKLYERAQRAARVAHEAATRAEEANRVKDEFLATVSHELRTPLNAILGWATMLRARPLEGSMAKAVEVIHRNAQAQGKLVDDILDVSRIITGKLRLDLAATDLAAVVRDALDVVRPSARARRITLTFHEPEIDCRLTADAARLAQVAWNLLSNAIKYSDAGASVDVSIGREAELLVLTVQDTGRGIDPAFLPSAFDRFQQADSSMTRSVGGLGLGLAIVRHIVELHGGSVAAFSEGLGKGARLRVKLPAHAQVLESVVPVAPMPEAPRPALRVRGALAELRVLVVDDDPDVRELLQAVLSEAGAEVLAAESAHDGQELLVRFRPHVLVSDIGMPEVDGYALIRAIRTLDAELGGGTPALALSAYTRSVDKQRALAAGFSAHLNKPVDPHELVQAVAALARSARGAT